VCSVVVLGWARKLFVESKQGRCDGCLFVGVTGFSCLCQQKQSQSLLLRVDWLAAHLAGPHLIDKHDCYWIWNISIVNAKVSGLSHRSPSQVWSPCLPIPPRIRKDCRTQALTQQVSTYEHIPQASPSTTKHTRIHHQHCKSQNLALMLVSFNHN
jgi:hypothetical protein